MKNAKPMSCAFEKRIDFGALGRIRTYNQQIMSLLL